MGGLWKLITAPAAGPLAGAAAIGVALLLAFVWTTGKVTEVSLRGEIKRLDGQVTTLTKERDRARSDLSTCRTNRVELQGALNDQSAQVRRWKQAAADAAARFDVEIRAARAGRDRAARDAGAILATKAGPDMCASADAIILESLK